MYKRMCYFGCGTADEVQLYKFPSLLNKERYYIWKAVLKSSDQEKTDKSIQTNLRLCEKHFEPYFRLPSHRLTANAIPTLNLVHKEPSISNSNSTSTSIERYEPFEPSSCDDINTSPPQIIEHYEPSSSDTVSTSLSTQIIGVAYQDKVTGQFGHMVLNTKYRRKCYFGCGNEDEVQLHKFPSLLNKERYYIWKAVLKPSDQERTDKSIRTNLRLCDNHFEPYFRLPSHRLTANSIPTLNLVHKEPSISESKSTSDIIEHNESNEPSSSDTTSTSPPTEIIGSPYTSYYSVQIKLEKRIKFLKNKISSTRNIIKNRKKEICIFEKQTLSKSLYKLMKKLPNNVKMFINILLKWAPKLQGRKYNYTYDEKLMTHALFKQHPNVYKYLSNIFILPAAHSLCKSKLGI